MKTKLILTLASMLLFVTGLRAAVPGTEIYYPYAVYCAGDQSFHFVTTTEDTAPSGKLGDQDITEVWQIFSTGNPGWNSSPYENIVPLIRKVVFEVSFSYYQPQICWYWFQNFSGLTEIVDLKYLNTSKVTDMTSMFEGCKSLTSLDLNLQSFNTSKVTDMRSMFSGCSGLTSLDLSSFNTSMVQNMSRMFEGCKSLTSLDLSNFDTSSVTGQTATTGGMTYMFKGCSGLTSLDLSNFNTSNVTTMGGMFMGCSSLTSLNLSSFKTSIVTNMGEMFSGCSSLTSLNLSSFNTSNVTNMGGMFMGCSSLTSLNLSNFNTSSVTYMNSMFSSCSGLTSLDLSKFDTSKVTSMSSMFNNCSGLTSLDLSNFNTPYVTNTFYMFNGCSGLTTLNLNNFDFSSLSNSTYMYMFDFCTNLRLVDLSKAVSYSVTTTPITQNALVYVPAGTEVPDGIVNVVIGGNCANFVINYGTTENNQNLLNIPYRFTAEKVTINRKFENDVPYSLFLPFGMSATEYGTFYTYADWTGTSVLFNPVTEATTTAHTPYMLLPADDYADGIVIEGQVTVETTPENVGTETDGYIGVYEKKNFTEDDEAAGVYYGWAGTDFRRAGAEASVDACRAYLKLPSNAAFKAPARIAAKFGDNVLTGISDVNSDETTTDSPCYDLNGRRVTDSYRGILIKDGKKIVNTAL